MTPSTRKNVIRDFRRYFWIRTSKDTFYVTYDSKPTVHSFSGHLFWDGGNVFPHRVKWMNLIETDDIIIVPHNSETEVFALTKSCKLTELPLYNSKIEILRSYVDSE